MNVQGPSRQVYVLIFVSLMMLLALSVGVAFLNLGRWNMMIALAIATAKALLVILYFMHARYTGGLIRLVAAGAFVWLGILIVYALGDYLTRGWSAVQE